MSDDHPAQRLPSLPALAYAWPALVAVFGTAFVLLGILTLHLWAVEFGVVTVLLAGSVCCYLRDWLVSCVEH
jgi:hypothetical protein